MTFSRETDTADPQNANWMISFGDLLTLLVCFFLVILSDIWRKKANPAEAVRPLTASITSETSTGTTFASTSGERLISELAFSNAGFLSVVNEPSTATSEAIKQWLGSVPQAAILEIGACSRGADGWRAAEDRAVAIRRLALEAGIATRRMRLKAIGPECSALEYVTPLTEEPVAVVRAVKN